MRNTVKAVWLATMLVVPMLLLSVSAATAQDKIKIGFSLPAVDEYYSIVVGAAEASAAANGVELIQGHGVSGGDPTVQISQVQTILAQGVQALVISPQSEALAPILTQAADDGVKIIFLDQQIPGFERAEGFIGTDNPKGSALMGEWLAQRLGGQGKVGVLVGSPGIPVSEARINEMERILNENGIEVIRSSQQDLCQIDVAIGIFQNFLTANPDIDAMYTICGPDGQAVNKVLSEMSSGTDIISTTWDVPVTFLQDIKSGLAEAAVAQFPVRAAEIGIESAIKVINGESIPAIQDSGTELVTAENVDTFIYEGDSGYSVKASE